MSSCLLKWPNFHLNIFIDVTRFRTGGGQGLHKVDRGQQLFRSGHGVTCIQVKGGEEEATDASIRVPVKHNITFIKQSTDRQTDSQGAISNVYWQTWLSN